MATLEYSDLSTPTRKLSEAARSLKRWKDTRAYRDQLRALVRQTVPATATAMEKRSAELLKLEAEMELEVLRTGAEPDVFSGVIKFATPKSD
jgi:hypothetical protein